MWPMAIQTSVLLNPKKIPWVATALLWLIQARNVSDLDQDGSGVNRKQ